MNKGYFFITITLNKSFLDCSLIEQKRTIVYNEPYEKMVPYKN